MDDRESLYFDTISLADSEAAAAAAAHRKSLSQSRNTIYYSAADLAGDETPAKRTNSMRLENGHKGRSSWNPSYRHSSPLDHYLPPNTNGSNSIGGSGNPSLGAVSVAGIAGGNGADYTDAVIAAQVMALQQNGRSNYTAGGASESALHMANDMEVSRRLLQNSAQSSRDKKLPITYSQWKFRVTNFNSLCFFVSNNQTITIFLILFSLFLSYVTHFLLFLFAFTKSISLSLYKICTKIYLISFKHTHSIYSFRINN